MTSLKRRRYIERYVTMFGATKTFQHGNTKENLLYTTIYISFVMQSVSFLVLYQTFPYIGSSGSRYDMYNTDFHLKISEISNIACRWVKMIPEILKPAQDNFVFGVCKLFHINSKTNEGPRSRTDGYHPT